MTPENPEAARAVFDYLDREGVLVFADDGHRQRVIDGLAPSCLNDQWPCFVHDSHVLKHGRYWPGAVPEEFGAGDWEPAPHDA